MIDGVATMADIEAIEGVPLAARDLPPSTYEAIRRGANINLDKIALQFFLEGPEYIETIFYSYRDLLELINQTANMFHEFGIGKDDVVSMILPNIPQSFFTIWGGEAAGIVNPINPLLEPQVMADIMNAAGTKVLVTLAPFFGVDIWPKVASIADQVESLETILRVDLANYLTTFKRYVVKLATMTSNKGPRVRARVLDFGQTARRFPGDKLASGRQIQPDDVASYFHTGGTTGVPKLAQHTHFNEVFDAWSASATIVFSPEKVLFCGLPLFHVNGVIVTGLIPWMHGASVILGTPQGYRAVVPHFWEIVDYYKINFFSGVPTVFSSLLNVPVGESDISSLEFALCGAAPMPEEVFHQFEARTDVRILEGYGLTEGTCVSSVNPYAGEKRIGSVGFRLPYQDMQVVKLDSEGNFLRDCAVDEIGAVIIRGPNVFNGYKEEIHNQKTWVDRGDGQGLWLNTGDLGRLDAEGYFWLTGREKELIIRGGHNIDPKLIEDPLFRHPDVIQAAAVGRPDPYAGEVPVAYVQLDPQATITEEDLLAYARENIGERAAVPKAIRIVEEIPQTAVGKISKPPLVRQEAEDALQTAVEGIAGIQEALAEARPDKLHGMAIVLTVTAVPGTDLAALEEEIRQLLGQYTLHYELIIA